LVALVMALLQNVLAICRESRRTSSGRRAVRRHQATDRGHLRAGAGGALGTRLRGDLRGNSIVSCKTFECTDSRIHQDPAGFVGRRTDRDRVNGQTSARFIIGRTSTAGRRNWSSGRRRDVQCGRRRDGHHLYHSCRRSAPGTSLPRGQTAAQYNSKDKCLALNINSKPN